MGRTQTALVARGFDSAKAEALAKSKKTLGQLQQMPDADLQAIGLTTAEIESIRDGGRPPIPPATVETLLFANRYQCCVCRNPSRPIIIHHVEEWHLSRSHDISNLAVLCLDHHQQAHSKSSLSQNLDGKTLLGFKAKWEAEVKRLDPRAIIDALKGDYSHWSYINELRLFELAQEHGVDLLKNPWLDRAHAAGLVDAGGVPLPTRTTTFYKYEGPAIVLRYAYMKHLLNELIDRIHVANISDHLDRSVVPPLVLAGDFIFVQGRHVFSPLDGVRKGIGQHYRGVRAANAVEVCFAFDRWEATSSSARSQWLSGTKAAGSLVQVKDISRIDGKLVLTGTALAVSAYTPNLKSRSYGNFG